LFCCVISLKQKLSVLMMMYLCSFLPFLFFGLVCDKSGSDDYKKKNKFIKKNLLNNFQLAQILNCIL